MLGKGLLSIGSTSYCADFLCSVGANHPNRQLSVNVSVNGIRDPHARRGTPPVALALDSEYLSPEHSDQNSPWAYVPGEYLAIESPREHRTFTRPCRNLTPTFFGAA